jgi:hypothetical protein
MAREIFLLSSGELGEPEKLPQTIDTLVSKLGMLGVGTLEEVRPTIFRPSDEPYTQIAAAIFTATKARSIYNLDPLRNWSPPFNSQVQVAACLGSSTGYALSQSQHYDQKARHQQRIVIGQCALADEFMRLNPSGMFAEALNLEAEEPAYSYTYRFVGPDPRTGQR